jgi:serine O-acetyltransferase
LVEFATTSAPSRSAIRLRAPNLKFCFAIRACGRCGFIASRTGSGVTSYACRRFYTGVDIHPGALIGRRLFIDHATGVVIGETAIVGSDVTMYQGVTLGGTGKQHGKRHPTICDNVFVGNNANILGNVTVGENSRVGAGSVVLSDVPPNSTVVGVPAHIVYHNGQRVLITDPHEIKDPLSDALIALSTRVDELEDRLGARDHRAKPFADEEAERAAYSQELERLRVYVSMGEGI